MQKLKGLPNFGKYLLKENQKRFSVPTRENLQLSYTFGALISGFKRVWSNCDSQ